MSRIDRHVGQIRFRLALGTFLTALAWGLTGLGAGVLLAVLAARLVHFHLPWPMIWLWSGLGLSILLPIIYTVLRRPTPRQAAVAIDQRLSLNEKFSTALYVRGQRDPFAAAAVRDAESTAQTVRLGDKFPLSYPRAANGTFAVALVAIALLQWMPQFDLLGAAEKQAKIEQQRRVQTASAERAVKQALAEIEAAPREVSDKAEVQMAHKELSRMLDHPISDAPKAAQKAQDALKQIEAARQQIKNAQRFATTMNEVNNLKNVGAPSPEETGPVADAHRAILSGKFEEATEKLKDTVDKFDKMDKKEQEKAAQQMQNLANQIAKQANNPQAQQQIQNQLQQAGVNQQQAQQMSKLMQQAAQGNQAAQQQLQQMANQAIQQANQQNPGASQQQQKAMAQAIQNAVQNGQQQANGQASAQQMAASAQALAQAMKQAAGGQKGAQQGGQQGGQQQSAQASAQQGQPGQGQPGQQGQGQQGQGQQGQGQSAKQQMQQQVAQLQAMAKDAQAVAAGQQGSNGQGQGQGQQANGQNNGAGQQQGQWGGQGQGGQWQQGNPQQQQGQGGQGGPAVAAGGKRPDPIAAPFGVKQELSASETIDKGEILASTFVKAPAERGTSHLQLSQAVEAESKEAAEEVDQDRIPRGAQKAVKEYFETLKQAPPQ